jgi:hypothetical protein
MKAGTKKKQTNKAEAEKTRGRKEKNALRLLIVQFRSYRRSISSYLVLCIILLPGVTGEAGCSGNAYDLCSRDSLFESVHGFP